MDVALQGSTPSVITAGIMLLTRARQLGYKLDVSVIATQNDLVPIPGPAVVYAPVLASCGVGRELGSGATVVLGGPPGRPVMVSIAPHGVDGWFLVDRTGHGAHPATRAFTRLARDPRVKARHQGKELRRVMNALGMTADTAVLDVLFGAPAPPLLRLSLALRAGRAMAGGRGEPITRYLAGSVEHALDPIDAQYDPTALKAMFAAGEHKWVLDRLSTVVRDRVEEWIANALALGEEDDDRDLVLLHALSEVASHLTQLPVHSILPPLGAAEDSVAVGLGPALRAEGDGDAHQQLSQVFRFLGGKFVDSAPHSMMVSDTPPPSDPDDLVGRWHWFSQEARRGRKRADALWPMIVDPPC